MSHSRTFRTLPPAALARAVALIRKGYAVEVAAQAAGFSGRALRSHLATRGTDARRLRGGPATLAHRRPCRFCDDPVRPPAEVCAAADCRELAWAALPAAEQAQRVRRAWAPNVAATTRFNAQVGAGRRLDVHVLLPAAAVAQLHEHAARRGVSLSRLIAETLRGAGLIDPT